MQKFIFIFCALLIRVGVSHAQYNLVLNPSFEEHTHCPDNDDEAKYCTYWSSLDTSWSPPDWSHDLAGVPEYCHICATDVVTRPPFGYSRGHYARTGDGLMRLQTYWSMSNYGYARDYVQGHLSQFLLAGTTYYLSFYVALTTNRICANDKIGAYVDDGTIDTTRHPGWVQSQFTPQVYCNSIITDTVNWVRVQGVFTAHGGEKLITIGNFFDKEHTNLEMYVDTPLAGATGFYSYYLVDDVSLLDCDTQPFAGNDTTIVPGDTITLGRTEQVPFYWYVLGGTTPIDSGGSIRVHPTVRTTYVVKQAMCGDRIHYDTIVVSMVGDTVAAVGNVAGVNNNYSVYPNPAKGFVSIANAQGCTATLIKPDGGVVLQQPLSNKTETVSISGIAAGVYELLITEPTTGYRTVQRLVVMEQ